MHTTPSPPLRSLIVTMLNLFNPFGLMADGRTAFHRHFAESIEKHYTERNG